jgi:flagellar biosynthesis/type III secretory pathway protein FliH
MRASKNPFAFVVLTHLAKMEADSIEAKYDAKLELGKMLYDKGYKEEDVIKLYRFLDWLIQLGEKQEQQFNTNLKQYEEERRQVMAYVTSAERIGIKKGRREGLEQGRLEAQQQLREKLAGIVRRLAERKFGELEPELVDSINNLSVERLDELTIAVLDFAEPKDLQTWLKANQTNRAQT